METQTARAVRGASDDQATVNLIEPAPRAESQIEVARPPSGQADVTRGTPPATVRNQPPPIHRVHPE